MRGRFGQLALAGEEAFGAAFDRSTRTSRLNGVTLGPMPWRERGAALARAPAAAQATGLDRMTDRRFTHMHLTRGRRLRAPLV